MIKSYIIESLDLLRTTTPEKIGAATRIAYGSEKLPGKRWMWWTLDKVLMIGYLALIGWILYLIFF